MVGPCRFIRVRCARVGALWVDDGDELEVEVE